MADLFYAPPQAITREMITQAYDWMKAQPQAVKDRAKSVEDMVGLYLHQRRHGRTPARSASEESFQADLKAVAEGLRQFDDSQNLPQQASPPTGQRPTPAAQQPSPPHREEPMANPRSSHPQPTYSLPIRELSVEGANSISLDERSMRIAREVRDKLNLTSEAEAVRMLLVIGSERLLAFLTARS